VSQWSYQANDHSSSPAISADGRYVAFQSGASNLVPDEPNNAGDIFVYDRETGNSELVSYVGVEATKVSAFMEAVRVDIEQSLTGYGAQIAGCGRSGNDGEIPAGALPNVDYFSIRYSLDETEGVINVWGVHDNGTHSVFLVLITESFGA
jgi:hypothetical protein